MKVKVLSVLFIFLAVGLLPSFSRAKLPHRIIIISDNDDTLEITGIKAFDFWKILGNVALRHQSFAGMATAYNAMATNGIEIQYVSGSPASAVTDLFLRDNNFPQGVESHRTDDDIAHGMSTEDFKVIKITAIMEQILSEDPDAQFVLVGDNGEKDPLSYARLSADPKLSKSIMGVYIHNLYGEGVATPLQRGQWSYPSAVEFGLFMNELNLLQTGQLENVLMDVLQNPDQAIPSFVTITREEANSLNQKANLYPDPRLKSLLEQVAEIEKNRCATPMQVISGN